MVHATVLPLRELSPLCKSRFESRTIMKPESSSNLGWLTIGVSALVLAFLGACQDAPTAAEKNPTQVTAEIKLGKEQNAPDKLTWRTTGAAQNASLTGSGTLFTATIALPAPLATGDSIWIQLWTAGMRTADLKYIQVAGSALKYADVSRPDPVALALLERLLLSTQRNHDTLLAVYAKALVDGDTAFKGFPKNCPTGIDTAAVIKVALAYALGKGTKLADLSAKWLLAIDTATVHERVLALVAAGGAKAIDTLGMFPPPPIRLKVPVSVASSVQAGGSAVAVAGAFEWDKGLGLVAINTYVIRGADTLSTVSVNGLPAIGTGDQSATLTGKAQIMAGSVAPVGICSLVVVVRDGNGNAARSSASFEILKGVVVPQTPTVRLLSPVEGKVVPFDTTSILVKWIASALNSKIDTVQIGDQMATQENDSVWSAWVPLAATGKPTVVTARAHSIQNVWAVQSASFTRSADLSGPTLTWVSPQADTAVESSTTSLVIRFKAQDPSNVDTILIDGSLPDSVTKAGVAWKTVALGASGSATPISVRVVDGAKNATVALRSVTRKLDNSLAIYALPDSVRVPEDSSLVLPLAPNCPTGSTCKLQAASGDTALLQAVLLGDTALRIVAKGDRNGSTTVSVSISSVSKQSSVIVKVVVAPINDAPTLSVKASLLGVPAGASVFADWLVSVSPGPSDEASQRISYLVAVDSGASLVGATPFVDATGRLNLAAKGISGVARLAVVAVDNGDSTGANRSHSAAQTLRVRLDAAPSLKVADTLVGYEDQRTKSDTVHLDDLESPDGLTLDWTILDTAILPKANLRVKAVAGGYAFDAQTAKDSSGKARIAWTLTDPVGNVVRDTSVVHFIPVNDAPVVGKAAGLPDTLVVPCTQGDTSFAKLYGDVKWEPGVSSQTGSVRILLADTAQAHLFYYSSNIDGIQPLANGGLRIQPQIDTDAYVRILIQAQDDGGTANGGTDVGTRSIWIHLTNTVKDVDGNTYTYRRMPGGYHWLTENIRTKPRNGDETLICGDSLYQVKSGCQEFGRIYTWQQAMNLLPTCTDAGCLSSVTEPVQGLCPEGWHIPSRSEWSALFQATMESGGTDSAYNLRSTDTTWSNYYEASSPMRYPGSGKYGSFLKPTWNIWSESMYRGSTGGVVFWLPTFSKGYSGDPTAPPAIWFASRVGSDYQGFSVRKGMVRCLR